MKRTTAKSPAKYLRREKEKRSFLSILLRSPILGALGILGTIASIVLGIYSVRLAKYQPDLSFFVYPARTIYYQRESELKVFFKKNEILEDVQTFQIAVWNRGRKPIEKKDILEPIFLEIDGTSTLVQARIIKTTREVTRITIDDKGMKDKRIQISWDILENGDGVLLQLLCTGQSTEIKIAARGTILGQKAIREVSYSSASDAVGSFVLLFLLVLGIIALIRYLKRRKLWKTGQISFTEYSATTPGAIVLIALFALAVVVIFLHQYLGIFTPRPPFSVSWSSFWKQSSF